MIHTKTRLNSTFFLEGVMPGLLFVAITAATWAATSATCADDPSFKARNGLPCSAWSGVDCFTTHAGLSEQGLAEVLAKCGATCGTCIPARDHCDNGQGGDRVTPNMMDKSSFTFVEDDLLDTACDWRVTGDALEQASNAYGNPEDNSLMGCMALLKNSNYNEFVMSVDIENFDDDGIGFVFGYKTKNDRYQVHMINDRWPDPAADSVPGPHLKIKMHNGKPASDHFDASNVPFDLLAYVANDKLRHDAHVYPGGKLASMKYIPIPYSTTYHNYGIETTLTLIVKDGQARAYFKAKDGATVGVWTDLPESYDGGEVGIFTYADEAVRFRNLRVTDIGAAAAPLSSRCEDPAKTCDAELGLCCDGPCVVPTPSPTVSPTVGYVENGHDVAASEVCPGAVGGTYLEPRMDLASFDLIDHPKLSEPCTWQNTNDGIKQTSNAWGNPGANSMMGCLALVNGHQYTDFMLEVDIESFDNDGVGIVFGYRDIDDHYVGIANNDVRILQYAHV